MQGYTDTKVHFAGPARIRFESFDDQAAYFLNSYCPGWNDYKIPTSHMIPRIHEYKNPEINDVVIDNLKKEEELTSNIKRLISVRSADDAENLIFRALNKITAENGFSPFLAIHNFNIDDRRIKLLKLIFPDVAWKPLEFDYVILGPKIGIVVIEVKSSSFSGKNDFGTGKTFLPDQYQKGIDQLQQIDDLLESISISTKTDKPPRSCIKKILFTPNLERKRIETWKSGLPNGVQIGLEDKMKAIQQVFKEDLLVDDFGMSCAYEQLRNLLQKSNRSLPPEIYEAYCKAFAGKL